jgi:hypothetical protein
VALGLSSTGGLGGANYFTVGAKSATSFEVQLRAITNGALTDAPGGGLTFDWIAVCAGS